MIKIDEQKLKIMKDEYNVPEIAKHFNCSTKTIYRRFKKLNIPVQNVNDTRVIWNENIFQERTPEVAYWAGFLLADGSIGKNKSNSTLRYYLTLSLHIKDLNHLNRYREFLGIEKSLRRVCQVSKINLIDDMIYWGICPNKTYEPIIPQVSDELFPHFLRGVIDGDGCIYTREKVKDKKNGINIKRSILINFCTNKILEEWFSYKINKLSGNIKYTISYPKTKNNTICIFKFNGMPNCIFTYSLLNNDLRMDRKWERIEGHSSFVENMY